MGVVCILIFAIIAILAGLWYGGIDVIPGKFEKQKYKILLQIL